MTTVRDVLTQLADAPPDAAVYAYEGEDTGLVIVDATGQQTGFIRASAADEDVTKTRRSDRSTP
jgi:hypothetical protein